MDSPIISFLFPSLLLVPAMGLLSQVRSRGPVGAEIRRKALHMLTGVAAIGFPYILTGPAQVVAAVSLVIGWMLAVRRIPLLKARFGCVLHDTARRSWGEMYFCVAVAGLLLLPHASPATYVIPLLILAFADAAAAIVGRTWRTRPLPMPLDDKTVGGTLAFVITAFIVTAAVFGWSEPDRVGFVLVLSACTAVLTAAAEAASTRGLDNLTVPAAAWTVLTLFLNGA